MIPRSKGKRLPRAEAVAPVLESLLHLLPTAASVIAADGTELGSEQASPLCRLLANPPTEDGPDLCRRDCLALAREAMSSGGRARGTCSAGLLRVAEPLPSPDGRPGGLGALVAAVGDPPRDAAHWEHVALQHGRPLTELLEAAERTPRTGLRNWEGEERVEVAASVLARVLAGTEGAAVRGFAPSARVEQSARRQTAELVLEVAHAAAGALGEDEILRYLPTRLKALLGLRAAWALVLRPDAHGGSKLLEGPSGIGAAAYGPQHPAIARAAEGRTAHHADLGTWPDGAELAGAGIVRLLVSPVRVLGETAALLFFALDPEEETPATISRRCTLLDDLTPIVAAHLTGARALAEERRRIRQLTTLHDVTRRMSASLDVEPVLDAVASGFLDALGYTRSAVFFHDAERGTIEGVVSRGAGTSNRVRLIEGPLAAFPGAARAAAAGRALYFGPDDDVVPRAHREAFGVTSFVLAPLAANGRLLGFIATDRGGERFVPSENELDFATTLAQAAALALANARLHATRTERADHGVAGDELAAGSPTARLPAQDLDDALADAVACARRALAISPPGPFPLRPELEAIVRASDGAASAAARQPRRSGFDHGPQRQPA